MDPPRSSAFRDRRIHLSTQPLPLASAEVSAAQVVLASLVAVLASLVAVLASLAVESPQQEFLLRDSSIAAAAVLGSLAAVLGPLVVGIASPEASAACPILVAALVASAEVSAVRFVLATLLIVLGSPLIFASLVVESLQQKFPLRDSLPSSVAVIAIGRQRNLPQPSRRTNPLYFCRNICCVRLPCFSQKFVRN